MINETKLLFLPTLKTINDPLLYLRKPIHRSLIFLQFQPVQTICLTQGVTSLKKMVNARKTSHFVAKLVTSVTVSVT